MRFLSARFRSPAGEAAVVGAGYGALALLLFCHSRHWESFSIGNGADVWSSIWFLNWWPWAIFHGHSALTSHYVYAPGGYDLTWATSVPAASLLALPITLAFGAAASFNALSLAAPALGAFCTYLLLRRGLCLSAGASIVCGFLFGFSSFENAQLCGHLNLDLDFAIPLACFVVVLRLRRRLGRRAFVAGLAATLVLQFGISTEIFATFVALGVLVYALFTAFASPDARPWYFGVGAEAAAGLAAAVVCVTPYLVHMALSAREFPDFINPPELYSTNLANLVLPTRVTLLGGEAFSSFSSLWNGNGSEQNAYLGLPLLAVVGLLAWGRGRERAVAALLLSIVGLFVASLGPFLHVGSWNSRIPLPWWLATHLPLMRGVLPSRFALYVALATAVAAAVWYEGASAKERARRFAGLVVCAAFLLPNPRIFGWNELPLKPIFDPVSARRIFGADATILILPYHFSAAGETAGMLWQWQSGMAFRQAGGLLSFVPQSFLRYGIVQQLYLNAPGPSFEQELPGFAASHHVTLVVSAPETPAGIADAVERLRWPRETYGGFTVYRVPAPPP